MSFPIPWAELTSVAPQDFTIVTAIELLADRDPLSELMPAPHELDADLIAEEGRAIPVARVHAMHDGKRRAKKRRESH